MDNDGGCSTVPTENAMPISNPLGYREKCDPLITKRPPQNTNDNTCDDHSLTESPACRRRWHFAVAVWHLVQVASGQCVSVKFTHVFGQHSPRAWLNRQRMGCFQINNQSCFAPKQPPHSSTPLGHHHPHHRDHREESGWEGNAGRDRNNVECITSLHKATTRGAMRVFI